MKTSLLTRQEWDEDERAEYEKEFFRTCSVCDEGKHISLMVQEQLSGLWCCESCKVQFLKEWEGEEKPIFKP